MERSPIFLVEPVPGIKRQELDLGSLGQIGRLVNDESPGLHSSLQSHAITVAPQPLLHKAYWVRADGKRRGEQAACGQIGANISVERTGRDEHWRLCSLNAGHWVLPHRYPVATRVRRTSKTFGNRRVNTRFGTEGSEVRILSPRPIEASKAQEIGPSSCTSFGCNRLPYGEIGSRRTRIRTEFGQEMLVRPATVAKRLGHQPVLARRLDVP